MTCGVYEIKNLETNQAYIGRSINIESRWNGHLSYPSNNMMPTVELYKKNPDMVEFNILVKIDEHPFDKEELKFITSVCELYEINRRGGWESDNLINGRDGDILACPPTILCKREYLPKCVDIEDILYGIEKWTNDVYRYRAVHNPTLFNDRTKHTDPDSGIYWRKQYLEIKEKYEQLKNREPSFIEQQKAHSLEYREKMSVDYAYFKLKKENAILTDEVDELKSKVSFWKEKCISWRNKYFSIFESVKQKQNNTSTIQNKADNSIPDLLSLDDLLNND